MGTLIRFIIKMVILGIIGLAIWVGYNYWNMFEKIPISAAHSDSEPLH